MADEITASAMDAPDQDTGTTETTEPTGQLGDPGKKALDSERKARRDAEARVKELEPLAAKLREIEDASKDDATRAAEALAAAERERDEARVDLARYRAAIDHGLTADDIALIGPGTPEEINERAAALAARIGDASKPVKPAPNPAQGRTGDPSTTTADQFADALSNLL